MGSGGRALAALMAAVAIAGCGSSTERPEGGFDPSTAEEFIRNKARSDVQANPVLTLREPQQPNVDCRSTGADPEAAEEGTVFACDVMIEGRGGDVLARQTWKAEVEVDPATGDTVVRSSRLVNSTIESPPLP